MGKWEDVDGPQPVDHQPPDGNSQSAGRSSSCWRLGHRLLLVSVGAVALAVDFTTRWIDRAAQRGEVLVDDTQRLAADIESQLRPHRPPPTDGASPAYLESSDDFDL